MKVVESNDHGSARVLSDLLLSWSNEVDGVWRVEALTPTWMYVVRVKEIWGLYRSLRAKITGTNEH